MSQAALDVIAAMKAARPSECVYEHGRLYVGNRRIPKGKAVLYELLIEMAIRRVEMEGCTAEYYRLPHVC